MQINKIRNEREVTNYNREIQMIIRDSSEKLYANKMGKLEEIYKFLETEILARLNQEENRKYKQTNCQ